MTDAQRTAEQVNILLRGTADIDSYCNQPLRATLDTEQVSGPDFRVTIQSGTGNGRVILSRWPVIAVTQVQVSPNSFPRQWTTVPSGYYDVEHPVIGVYDSVAPSAAGGGGQSILIDPGYVNWFQGRNGVLVRATYVNGWPHTSLTAAAASGASTLAVDDCTGWALAGEFGNTGAAGIVYDSGAQETVQVTAASATSGPGTLTLASALSYSHAADVIVSAMPASVQDAMILHCTAQALLRGATSTTVHQIPGGAGGTSGGKGPTPADYRKAGNMLVHAYRRTI